MAKTKKTTAQKKLKTKQTIFSAKTQLLKRYETDLRLFLIPLILVVIFSIISQLGVVYSAKAENLRLAQEHASFPITDYGYFSQRIAPPISAESALIMDRDSRVILYSKNPNVRFSMASTTKLMTALVSLDYYKPDDILTAQRGPVEGVNVGLLPGDKIYFKDALYAMLLPSGNDVAYLLADNYPGGLPAFVQKMNEKAHELSLVKTHYFDPAGLNDDGNYTTATELAELAAYATENQTLATVVATKNKTVSTVGKTKSFVLTNLNRLLGHYGVIGIKTGHTEGAGDVLITEAVSQGHSYIIVVMWSQDRFVDTEVLLSYVINNINFFTPRYGQ
jgi:D-alanyl-D-alanine carboxypeptidase